LKCRNFFTCLTILIITFCSVSCGKNSEKASGQNFSGYNDDTFQYLHNTDKVDSSFFSFLNSYLANGEYLGLERLYVLSDEAKRELIIDGIRDHNSELFISCYYEDITDSLFIAELKDILGSQNALDLFIYLKNKIASDGRELSPDKDYWRKTDDLIELIYDIDAVETDLKDSLMLLKQDVKTYTVLDSLKNKISDLSIKETELSEEIRLLEEYVEDNDYFYGGANIVGRLSNNVYEVTEQDPYQGLKRYVLITKETEFTSTGRFSLYLKNGGHTDVQLQSGFTESWPSIIEVTASEREYTDKQKNALKDKKKAQSILLEGYELIESMYYTDLNRLNLNYNTGSVTDIDGNEYNTVKIGDQWWMTENLRVTHYQDSMPIQNVREDDVWTELNTGAYCYYSNDRVNIDSYGALYNWYAVNDNRNIAPEGWRVATEEDWNKLELFLGSNDNPIEEINEKRDKDIAGKLKTMSGWDVDNNGVNEFAFSVLPSGTRRSSYYSNGKFQGIGKETIYWTDTEKDDSRAVGRAFRGSGRNIIDEDQLEKQYGASVRCIKGERPNKPPSASFIITPNSNSVDTTYTFNAVKSTDYEEEVGKLQFRWDFDSDGVWDNDWSSNPTTSYLFQEAGTFNITLEVQDTERAIGLTSSEVRLHKFGSVTDVDGNVYKTIRIANQVWLAENLKVTHYTNGDPIRNREVGNIDVKNKVGSYSYYDNEVTNLNTYGALYNWYAVNDNRNIAPEGWRVATEEDWNKLELFIADSHSTILRSRYGWGENYNGADDVGFCALPAGQRGYTKGDFGSIGRTAIFWTSNERDDKLAWRRSLGARGKDIISQRSHNKLLMYSVRCVKD
jgi:uncharacterized protein (TIGR02145 family)